MAAHNFNVVKIKQNKLRIICATSSNFVNNLIDLNGQNIDVTIDACKNSDIPYKELFGTYEYVSCQQHYWFNQKKNNDLFLIHFNVRSLQKHIDQLNNYLERFKNQPDIAAISETKLKEGLINRDIELEGYGFLHSDCKKCAGGVGLYIKDTIKFSIIQYSKICLPNAEHLCVDIQTKRGPIAVGVVYRHPDNSATTVDKFNKCE